MRHPGGPTGQHGRPGEPDRPDRRGWHGPGDWKDHIDWTWQRERPRPPWARVEPPWARPRRQGQWPAGAVIGAVLFHVLGVRDVIVHHDLDALVYALLLAGPLALFWRRRAPIAVFAVAAVASILFATIASPHWTYAVAPILALYSLSCAGRHRAAAVAGGVAYAVYLLVTLVLMERLGLPGTPPGLRESLILGGALAGSVIIGVVAKSYAEQVAAITRVREEQARARAEQERRQASEERLRIARELHDVLGHHLSLINVQAGVGLHLMDSRPEQAREALTAIKTASSEALREVRSVLGALRTEGEAAPRQPALGLNRLEDLTADAGIPVRTVITGEPRDLPAEVDRAAYRIVQEALTNVRRHATPSPEAVVTVNYLPTALYLSVRNNAPPSPSANPSTANNNSSVRSTSPSSGSADPSASNNSFAWGDEPSIRSEGRSASNDSLPIPDEQPPTHNGNGRSGGPSVHINGDLGPSSAADNPGERGSGIAGMRARAESLGGRFAAGPLSEGGFLVSVVLPVGDQW